MNYFSIHISKQTSFVNYINTKLKNVSQNNITIKCSERISDALHSDSITYKKIRYAERLAYYRRSIELCVNTNSSKGESELHGFTKQRIHQSVLPVTLWS